MTDDLATVHVSLQDKPYEIRIANDWLPQIAGVARALDPKIVHAAVVCDAAITGSHGASIAAALEEEGIRVSRFDVPSGEPSKSVEQLSQLWHWLLAERSDRQTMLFAVGGGVVGDLAGFAAASFARGISLIQIPTTLLSQVDSSVGGKTGINLPDAKNIVGAFWQPRFVAIDTATLKTLPDREFISGFGEVIKYGVILDAAFFDWIEANSHQLMQRDPAALRRAIQRSCELKAEVVVADQFETTGLRAVLNYGHTFAHAIEATAGYGRYLHGEAVTVGMQMAAELACRLRRVDRSFVTRQGRLIEAFGLPATFPTANVESMLTAMSRDKKVAHGKLRFVLPTRLGHVELVDDVERTDVVDAITACR